MSLELLVMPLHRFYSGQFEGPLEQLAGGEIHRIGAQKPDVPEDRARAYVESLKQRFSRETGELIEWKDEGETVFSVQYDYAAYTALRAFAAYQEHPPPKLLGLFPRKFNVTRKNAGDHHSFLTVAYGAPTSYPHLIHHHDNDGFWLPCRFQQPIRHMEAVDIEDEATRKEREEAAEKLRELFDLLGLEKDRANERKKVTAKLKRQQKRYGRRDPHPHPPPPPGKKWEYHSNIGSSILLLDELARIKPLLGTVRRWDELREAETICGENDPLALVKYAWSVLDCAARKSVESGLPIIFDG